MTNRDLIKFLLSRDFRDAAAEAHGRIEGSDVVVRALITGLAVNAFLAGEPEGKICQAIRDPSMRGFVSKPAPVGSEAARRNKDYITVLRKTYGVEPSEEDETRDAVDRAEELPPQKGFVVLRPPELARCWECRAVLVNVSHSGRKPGEGELKGVCPLCERDTFFELAERSREYDD